MASRDFRIEYEKIMSEELLARRVEKEAETRRALYAPERIERLAEHLCNTLAKASKADISWGIAGPATRKAWCEVARAAVDSITGGMYGKV